MCIVYICQEQHTAEAPIASAYLAGAHQMHRPLLDVCAQLGRCPCVLIQLLLEHQGIVREAFLPM